MENRDRPLYEIAAKRRSSPDTWIPLDSQARTQPLATVELGNGAHASLIEAVSGYTKRHLVTVVYNDNPDKGRIQSVRDFTPDQLLQFLQFSSDTADVVGMYEGTEEVDFGFNYSLESSRRGLASVPEVFHGHIVGYTRDDLSTAISRSKARRHYQWREGFYDPLAGISAEIFLVRGLPELVTEIPDLTEIMVLQEDHWQTGATFLMAQGKDSFSNPLLAKALQTMHRNAGVIYDEIAACFCIRGDDGQLVRSQENGRFMVIDDPNRRRLLVQEFIAKHEGMSTRSARMLQRLALTIKSADQVIREALMKARRQSQTNISEAEIITRAKNNQWFMDSLSYTMVWSIVNGEYLFGFEPRLLSAAGIPPLSRASQKFFYRTEGVFDQTQLNDAQSFERAIGNQLVTENPTAYNPGPLLLGRSN